MFNEMIKLYGKHADILRKYSKDKQAENATKFIVNNYENKPESIFIFDTMMQCYMVAAMIGIIEDKIVDVDRIASDNSASIFLDKVVKERDNLMRIYQHMILSDKTSGLSADMLVKKAFELKDKDSESEEMKKFNGYVRGGLEIIDDYFKDCSTYEDVANKIIDITLKYGNDFDN